MPVPALVAPEVCAAVQEPWRDQQRHARPSRRGARYVLHGLVQGQPCGYADDGAPRRREGGFMT
jgi:hypothetical protein